MPKIQLIYDDVIRKTKQIIKECDFRFKGLNEEDRKFAKEIIDNYIDPKGVLDDLVRSKVFWIDPMISYCLMNSLSELNKIDYFISERRFPFPKMFIEYGDGIEYNFLGPQNNPEKSRLEALLFSSQMNGGTPEFRVSAINKEQIKFAEVSYFKADCTDRPTERFVVTEIGSNDIGVYAYSIPDRVLLKKCRKMDNVFEDISKGKDDGPYFKEVSYKVREDDDYLDAFKLCNMIMNTIGYINAKNVEIRKEDRESVKETILKKIKGRFKNKKIERKLKPYYWIELKERVVYTGKRKVQDRDSWKLNCRFWVIGHPRYYDDGTSIWIDPFIKGPENAPWKENRYAVLYNRFKPYLDNPELRKIPGVTNKLNKELKKIKNRKG